ncbi:hypothetical protein [Blastococcus deserti]|uniref:Uncharacterized protein n=1 Tax=Blastococcus deserti TaxID=2259033 RepID=A0ABW4X5U2_9ACTN
MRRSLIVCRDGLSVAAALVLLTACGGSDGEESASSESSATSSSAAETTSGQADSEFCTEAAAIQESVGAGLTGQSDPAAVQQALQQAATEVRDVEPPEEIADDWAALADGIDQIAAALASVDPNDPNAATTFQQQLAPLQQELASSATRVQTYLVSECGLEVDATEPAAPTS